MSMQIEAIANRDYGYLREEPQQAEPCVRDLWGKVPKAKYFCTT